MRLIWAMLGILALCFGVVGMVLPLVPTVSFLLLAAFCFAQSSPVLHDWLLGHPVLGPPIRDWRAGGVIRRQAKIAATLSMAVVFGLSLALGAPQMVIWAQAVILSGVALFIWSRPSAAATG